MKFLKSNKAIGSNDLKSLSWLFLANQYEIETFTHPSSKSGLDLIIKDAIFIIVSWILGKGLKLILIDSCKIDLKVLIYELDFINTYMHRWPLSRVKN